MDATEDTICLEKYFFLPPSKIRWDSTRGRTEDDRVLYPSSRMIYHAPLKSFLSLQKTLFLAKQGYRFSPPFVSVQFSFRCERSVLVPRSKWIPVSYGQSARLMEGSVPNPWISEHRYFRVMFANIGIFIPMNFFVLPSFFFFSFFIFNFIFRAWSDDTVVASDASLAQIFIVSTELKLFFFFFWKFRVNIFRSWEL